MGSTLAGGLSVAGLAHQAQVAEARGERALARLAPVELAVRAVALQVCLPAARIGTGAQVHRLEGLAEHAHLVGGERELRHGGEPRGYRDPRPPPPRPARRRPPPPAAPAPRARHRSRGGRAPPRPARPTPKGGGASALARAERDAAAQPLPPRPGAAPHAARSPMPQRDARIATAGRMLEHELRRPGLAGRLAEAAGAGCRRSRRDPRPPPPSSPPGRYGSSADHSAVPASSSSSGTVPGRRQRRRVRTPRGAEAHRAVLAGLRGEAQRIAEQARLRLRECSACPR